MRGRCSHPIAERASICAGHLSGWGTPRRRSNVQLPAPPQHEWLEAVKYWNDGGRAPVWFVVDPRRASIDLVQHGRPARYEWSAPYPILMNGTRPGEADWYRVERPDWYVGEGWALTPESAGVAERDRRGLQYGAIEAWVRRVRARRRSAGHRRTKFRAVAEASPLSVGFESAVGRTLSVQPGAFLQIVRLPGDSPGTCAAGVREADQCHRRAACPNRGRAVRRRAGLSRRTRIWRRMVRTRARSRRRAANGGG